MLINKLLFDLPYYCNKPHKIDTNNMKVSYILHVINLSLACYIAISSMASCDRHMHVLQYAYVHVFVYTCVHIKVNNLYLYYKLIGGGCMHFIPELKLLAK